MSTPLISVCVPVYNGAEFIEECLASVAAQTCSDYEVVILDDCSSDDGLTIARRWAGSNPRVQVHVNERNLGLVDNWNRCVALARGRWIKFLFQDNLMEADCLAELLKAAESGSRFIACSRKLMFEGEIKSSLLQEYEDHRLVLSRIYGMGRRLSPDEYTSAKLVNLGWNIVGEPSVTMIDRRLFEEYGLFDPMLVQFCDSEMWNRLGSNVGVDYLGKQLVSFRVHQGSASEANRGRNFRAAVLDAIIELNRLCNAPFYVRFRRHAKATGRYATLKRHLRHSVNAAFSQARSAAAERPANNSLQKELQAVLSRLPGYATARFGYVLHRARRFVVPPG